MSPPNPDPGPGRRIAPALVAISALGALVHAWLFRHVTVDDAYIVLRYAENFAAGHGLVYNPGERTDGYTCFLWVAVASAAATVGIPALAFLKGLGIALNGATVVALWRMARALRFGSALLAASPAALLAANGAFAYEGVAGLETPLFLFLLVAGTGAVLRDAREGRAGWSWPLAAGALALTRPEGALFFPVFLAYRLLARPASAMEAASAGRVAARAVALFAAIYLPYFAGRWVYYGAPLPNSYYAKAPVGIFALVSEGAYRALVFLDDNGGYLFALALCLALLRLRGEPWKALFAVVVASRVLFHVWSGGPVMGEHRFLVPALPFLFVLLARALDEIVAAFGRFEGRPSALAAAWAALVVIAVSGFAVKTSVRKVALRARRYMWLQAAAFEGLGKRLRTGGPPGATIVCGDAGAIPYFSGLRNLDYAGLNDRFVANLLRERPEGWRERYLDHLFADRPAWVVLTSKAPDEFVSPFEVARLIADSRQLREGYEHEAILSRYVEREVWVFLFRRMDLPPLDPPIGRRTGSSGG